MTELIKLPASAIKVILNTRPNTMDEDQKQHFIKQVSSGQARVYPIRVMKYRDEYYLVDGHIRLFEILMKQGIKTVEVEVVGEAESLEDVFMEAIRANIHRGNLNWINLAFAIAEYVRQNPTVNIKAFVELCGVPSVKSNSNPSKNIMLAKVVEAILNSSVAEEIFREIEFNDIVLLYYLADALLTLDIYYQEGLIDDEQYEEFIMSIKNELKPGVSNSYIVKRLRIVKQNIVTLAETAMARRRKENITSESMESEETEYSDIFEPGFTPDTPETSSQEEDEDEDEEDGELPETQYMMEAKQLERTFGVEVKKHKGGYKVDAEALVNEYQSSYEEEEEEETAITATSVYCDDCMNEVAKIEHLPDGRHRIYIVHGDVEIVYLDEEKLEA